MSCRHLFLTGEPQCGKSTLIRRVLARHPDWKVGGFLTCSIVEDGYRRVHMVPAAQPDAPRTQHNLVGEGDWRQVGKRYPEVFDTLGVQLLEEGAGANLLLMDELGTIESEALAFQHAVFRALDRDTSVLGVLKHKSSPFLDALRQRCDLRVLEVDLHSRNGLADEVDATLIKWIDKSR